MLVFVIDDNPDDRTLVLHQLKAALPEATVREIGDAEQLEGAFSQEKPSLVITDLALGWTSGLDVLRRVKALDPDCPVIMFTGAGDEQAAVEAMKAGLDDYVVKSPKRLARLQASIRDVAEKATRKTMARPSEHQSETVAAERQLNGKQYARIQNELNAVIALLRKTAEQQSDPKIADQFATAANQLTSLVDLLVRR